MTNKRKLKYSMTANLFMAIALVAVIANSYGRSEAKRQARIAECLYKGDLMACNDRMK